MWRMGAGTHPWWYPAMPPWVHPPTSGYMLYVTGQSGYKGMVLWAQFGHCVTLKWHLK